MARKTRSQRLYQQIWGRGTRVDPKLIADFAGRFASLQWLRALYLLSYADLSARLEQELRTMPRVAIVQ